MRTALFILVLVGIAPNAAAAPRSAAVKAEFQRTHPCPATGLTRGACPGWVKDHIIPLCAGGPDSASNMQWQTVRDAKSKDLQEHRQCRSIRKSGPSPA